METFDLALFILIVVMIFLSGSLVMGYNLKPPKKMRNKYASAFIFTCLLVILPFFDILQIHGFLASVIIGFYLPSIYGTIAGILLANLFIYGVHVFFSSMNQIKDERHKKRLVVGGQYSLRRHPVYASYHILGLGYQAVMGSITGVIIITIFMIILFIEAPNIEEKILIPQFKEHYLEYIKKVPKKIYSTDILLIVIVMYGFFIYGVIDSIINPIA